jgi:hypothetical protein
MLLLSLAVAVALSGLSTLLVWSLRPANPTSAGLAPHVAISIAAERLLWPNSFGLPVIAVSPDGSRVAYVAVRGNAGQTIHQVARTGRARSEH